MRYTVPDYYGQFTCTADGCEDTCCAQWQIFVDEKSLRRYRKVKGDFGKRLRSVIDFKTGEISQSAEHRCAFLNEDNLCDIYTELGCDALCATCRRYPRHVEEFEGVREISLSLSCPEAARLILNKKEKTTFISLDRPGEESWKDFDPLLYSKLVDARDVILRILQDREKPIPVRVGLTLGLAHDLQRRIRHRKIFSCEEVFRKYETPAAAAFVEEKIQSFHDDEARAYAFVREKFLPLYCLELLNGSWFVGLQETEDYVLPDEKTYAQVRREFGAWQKERLPAWETICEQILVYFIFTYFCGAVYDGEALAMAQMAAAALLHIQCLLMSRWVKNGNELTMEEVLDTVYRYSREIEHSEKNLQDMEEILQESFLAE